MKYGYFDDAAKEYVITRPDTPQSWSNYLGTTEYGALITNNAGGYGFYQSGARGRFLRLRFNNLPMDQPGRYFYLRDRESGDYWTLVQRPGSYTESLQMGRNRISLTVTIPEGVQPGKELHQRYEWTHQCAFIPIREPMETLVVEVIAQ